MKRSRMGAILAVAGWAALSAPLARPAAAATVFSNYNGVNCHCGVSGALVAEGFTPTSSYDFTGAAAFIENENDTPQSLSLALYSSTSAGAPDSSLWTSGTLSAPGPSDTGTLVTATYGGSPIPLHKGTKYFFAVDISNIFLLWLGNGSSTVSSYFSNDGGISWTSDGPDNLQFEVSGSPATVVPEPTTWALMTVGFAGLGFVGYRRTTARRSPSLG